MKFSNDGQIVKLQLNAVETEEWALYHCQPDTNSTRLSGKAVEIWLEIMSDNLIEIKINGEVNDEISDEPADLYDLAEYYFSRNGIKWPNLRPIFLTTK
jgi:hypothetical protein